MNHHGAGRPKTLTEEEENTIVEYLIARAEFGYLCDRIELMNLVGENIKSNDIKNVFKDGIPGKIGTLGL